jgi:hypothetical protein
MIDKITSAMMQLRVSAPFALDAFDPFVAVDLLSTQSTRRRVEQLNLVVLLRDHSTLNTPSSSLHLFTLYYIHRLNINSNVGLRRRMCVIQIRGVGVRDSARGAGRKCKLGTVW